MCLWGDLQGSRGCQTVVVPEIRPRVCLNTHVMYCTMQAGVYKRQEIQVLRSGASEDANNQRC